MKAQKLTQIILLIAIVFFSNDLFAQEKNNEVLIPFKYSGKDKVGYMNTKRQVIIEPQYSSGTAYDYHDFYTVSIGKINTPEEKYGVINKEGKLIIDFTEGYQFISLQNFKIGIIEVKKNSKYGFVNIKNEILLPIIHDYIGIIANGFISVQLDKKQAVFNDSLKMVVGFKYDDIGIFSDSLYNGKRYAAILLNKKYGYIDNKGNVIIPFIYNEAYEFDGGRAKVAINNKYGYIDTNGKVIVKIIYNEVYYNFETKNLVANDGKYEYTFDTKGKLLKKQKYIIPTKEIES
jgi:hypothetical protein